MRILALDIEMAPNLGDHWGLFDQNIGLVQLRRPAYMLCWGARWYGEKRVHYRDIHHDGRHAMVEGIRDLMDEADVIMGWNSRRFDVPHLNREIALTEGLTPPSPHKDLDLMVETKRAFRFVSNKLDHVATQFQVGHKIQHEGHALWQACMDGDEKAWSRMKRYQVGDVNLLIPLYEKLRPWIRNHPHIGVHDGLLSGCPRCGSGNVQRRGTAKTATGSYARFQCQACAGWSRGPQRLATSELRPV